MPLQHERARYFNHFLFFFRFDIKIEFLSYIEMAYLPNFISIFLSVMLALFAHISFEVHLDNYNLRYRGR